MTGPESIARKTLSGMSATHKGEVDDQLNKTLKKKINREVKGVIVDIANRELLDNLFMEHLTKSVAPLSEMVHFLKPTMQALMGTLNTIKVGVWVEVLYSLTLTLTLTLILTLNLNQLSINIYI